MNGKNWAEVPKLQEDPRPINEQFKRCDSCEGSGLLGLQRESCWFCDGEGYVEIPLEDAE